ncbi:MAG TPA: hypothetical protein VEA63_08415 [Opitutus sp.]|nr:hypothetical protein [Opitutus sp.]
MSSRTERSTIPPPAPPSKRRIRFPVAQIVGLGMFSVLPILAIFDRFGTGETRLTASSDDVSVAVEYSPRVRYGLPTQVRIEARAAGGRDAGPVTVRVEREFVDRFAQLSLLPEPSEMEASSYTFVLPASDVGGAILIELEPEQYGPARGSVIASTAGGGAEAKVELSAFIFP